MSTVEAVNTAQIAIIGAGSSGLAAAHVLQDAGMLLPSSSRVVRWEEGPLRENATASFTISVRNTSKADRVSAMD